MLLQVFAITNSMTNIDPIHSQLRGKGFRVTPQRQAILHVLQDANEHITASEIYNRASTLLPGLTEPTVYRTLEFLAENGFAFPTQTWDGHMAFEIAAHEHHHLLCRACGLDVEISHKELAQIYKRLEQMSGFKLTGGHLTFLGLCPHCQ
jgi:Fe2+ or Zn2+ uptake regulation protein